MATTRTTPTDRRAPRRGAPPPSGGKPRRKRRRSLWWRFRRPLFVIFFLLLCLVAGTAYRLSKIPLPSAPALSQTTLVYDAAGNQLASLSSSEARVNVKLSQVPQVVIDAILSIEDHNFFHEGAISPTGILRAGINDLRGGSLEGGSTITQQYVKQTYTGTQRTILRKIKEAVLAEKLERKESKSQILNDYLNVIYLGRGAYGVEAAAEVYFGRPVEQLGLAQASMLAGLIHDPDADDPYKHPAAAKARQEAVLRAMVRYHKITEAQLNAVEATPTSSYLNPTANIASGVAVDIRDGDQFFVDAVRQQLIAQYGATQVFNGGLRVYTTLNPTLQHYAYGAIYGTGPNTLNPAKGTPAGALVSVDNSGRVRAMVGGQNYGAGQVGISQVNLAMGAQGGGSGRQAGSTFKAFLLAAIIKEGYSVDSVVPAPPEVLVAHGNSNGTNWDVKNYEGEAPPSGQMSIVNATAQSVNTVFAQLVEKIGPDKLVAEANAMGIPVKEADPSIVLGTASVSPLEMASAYSTFANNGVHNTPILITKVTTASGKVLPFPHSTASTVLTPTQDQIMDYTLRQVVDGVGGTGGHASAVGVPVAGKTGTTDNSQDAWFIGFTPQMTTAVWEGFLKGEIPLPGKVVGGDLPTTMWTNYMTEALKYVPGVGGASFTPPVSLGGTNLQLTPLDEPNISFPKGLGTTTTTTIPPTTTTLPTTTVPGAATSTATTTPPPTTAATTPATTTPATTAATKPAG